MLEISRILYPTDFSRCADQALAHALRWAVDRRAELHVLHAVVLHDEDPAQDYQEMQELQGETRQRMEEAARRRLEQAGGEMPQIRYERRRGISPAPVILQEAAEDDVDLIVMGTHGRRGLNHLLLGSVAEEVVRQAPCAVLTVREREEEQPPEAIEKILVPVDFSEHSRRALAQARHIAGFYGAGLQLLHVVEQAIHPAFYSVGKSSVLDVIPDILSRSRAEMEQMLEDLPGPEVPTECEVVEGRAAGAIVRFAADRGSDMICIATHGLTGLDHFLMGSVAEKVVRRAPCPVFTLKAFGKPLVAG